MDIQFTSEDLAFQQEVRQFLKETFTGKLKDDLTTGQMDIKDAIVAWQKALYEQGWIVPNWPKEYGGTGWNITQKFIFEKECAAAGAPGVIPFGLKMVGPVIYTFGTPEQKERFLPGILQSNTWWCQGYSEPGAGSDLAALQTKAVRDGDEYIVTGQKTWTSYAQFSDWIFCLVRTDSNAKKKQEGISFLLIDMKTPGIEVRKIDTIDNHYSLNEVFFDDVRVPVENRVGEENKGWTFAKFLLTNERTAIAGVTGSIRAIENLKKLAAKESSGGGYLSDDTLFMAKLAKVEVDLMALEYTELRAIAKAAESGFPGPEASILKIRGTEIQQAIAELSIEASGYYAHARNTDGAIGNDYASGISSRYLYGRASSIFGGTNEVQKNIIAKMVLGL